MSLGAIQSALMSDKRTFSRSATENERGGFIPFPSLFGSRVRTPANAAVARKKQLSIFGHASPQRMRVADLIK
jgi:hypothetical protein